MADLASTGTRRESQRRLTTNRSSILPSRRMTDLPNYQVRADMRNAYRGDGGADELRRVLSDFTRGAQQAYGAYIENQAPKMAEQAAQAVLDEQTGKGPDEVYQKAEAYQEAYYLARTQRQLRDLKANATQVVQQTIAEGGDMEDVDAKLAEFLTPSIEEALGGLPEGVREARLALASGIQGMNNDLTGEAVTAITERTRTEHRDNVVANAIEAYNESGTFDLEGSIKLLQAGGFQPKEAIDALIEGAIARATDPEKPDPDLLEEILNSKKADGKTPSLNATQMIRAQERMAQATSIKERIEEEARRDRVEATTLDLSKRALNNEYVDDEIRQLLFNGEINAQEASAMLGLVHGLTNAMGEGSVNQDFLVRMQIRAAQGETFSTATINSWVSEGRLGNGRAAQRAAVQFYADATAERRRIEAAAKASRASGGGWSSQDVTAYANVVKEAILPGTDSEHSLANQLSAANTLREFRRRVGNGEDPRNVATQIIEQRTGQRVATTNTNANSYVYVNGELRKR